MIALALLQGSSFTALSRLRELHVDVRLPIMDGVTDEDYGEKVADWYIMAHLAGLPTGLEMLTVRISVPVSMVATAVIAAKHSWH